MKTHIVLLFINCDLGYVLANLIKVIFKIVNFTNNKDDNILLITKKNVLEFSVFIVSLHFVTG